MRDGNNLNIPVVHSGKYAGMDAFDLALVEALLTGAEAKHYDLMQDGKPPRGWRVNFDDAVGGIELKGLGVVFTEVIPLTTIASLFKTLKMQKTTLGMPVDLREPVWSRAGRNPASNKGNPAFSNLNAQPSTCRLLLSSLSEDAVIAALPILREDLVRTAAAHLDCLALSGLATKLGEPQPALDASTFRTAYTKLGSRVPLSRVAYLTDFGTFNKATELDEVQTIDEITYAPILNGQLGAIDGIPIVVPEQMESIEPDGFGNRIGRIIAVNHREHLVGVMPDLEISVHGTELVVALWADFVNLNGLESHQGVACVSVRL